MKVLNDRYNKAVQKLSDFPKKLVCESCCSELEYVAEDIRIGEFGIAFVDCPLCGYENVAGEEHNIILTMKNVEFPKHFIHTCAENGAVDCCERDYKEYLRKAINYFREYKDEFNWSGHMTGNLYIQVHRYENDEAYEVTISKDFYTTLIPFEEEDYKEVV